MPEQQVNVTDPRKVVDRKPEVQARFAKLQKTIRKIAFAGVSRKIAVKRRHGGSVRPLGKATQVMSDFEPRDLLRFMP